MQFVYIRFPFCAIKMYLCILLMERDKEGDPNAKWGTLVY